MALDPCWWKFDVSTKRGRNGSKPQRLKWPKGLEQCPGSHFSEDVKMSLPVQLIWPAHSLLVPMLGQVLGERGKGQQTQSSCTHGFPGKFLRFPDPTAARLRLIWPARLTQCCLSAFQSVLYRATADLRFILKSSLPTQQTRDYN